MTTMRKGIAALLACVAFTAGGVHAADRPVVLEFSSFLPANERLSLTLQEWGRELETRTDGRVKVNYHPGGTLTSPPQTYDSVVKDIVDVGFGPLGASSGRFPLMEVLDLPLGLTSSYSATMLSNAIVERFRPKELSDVKVLFMLSSPPAYIQSRSPVRSIDDLQGLKLRALGGTTVKVIQALGAVPVSIPPTDVYDALSKGVIAGAPVISDALVALKWEDSLRYTTVNVRTSYANNGYFVMNRRRFEALPPDVKAVIDELSREYVVRMSRLWDEKEAEAVAALQAKGHARIVLSAEEEAKWAQRLEPVYETYVKEKSARGLPAADALAFARDWVERNQR